MDQAGPNFRGTHADALLTGSKGWTLEGLRAAAYDSHLPAFAVLGLLVAGATASSASASVDSSTAATVSAVQSTRVAATVHLKKKYIGDASSCTNDLMPTGDDRASVGMSGYGTAKRGATGAHIGEGHMHGEVLTCDGHSFPESVSYIKTTLRYTVTFVHVSSCDIDIPHGVKCTLSQSGHVVNLTREKKCKHTAGCSVTFPSKVFVQDRYLDPPLHVQFKGIVTAKQGHKHSVTVSDVVHW